MSYRTWNHSGSGGRTDAITLGKASAKLFAIVSPCIVVVRFIDGSMTVNGVSLLTWGGVTTDTGG